jgi:hypothetical protein
MKSPRGVVLNPPSTIRRLAVIALCVTALNAIVFAWIIAQAASPARRALAPGDRLPPDAGPECSGRRSALVILDGSSAEDLWAIETARRIHEESPGHVLVIPGVPDGSSDETAASLPSAGAPWARRLAQRLVLRPAVVLVDEDLRVASFRTAPLTPSAAAAEAASFINGDVPGEFETAPSYADTTVPLKPGILDGPAAFRAAARDPVAAAFLRRYRSRPITRIAGLRFDERVAAYYWSVEFHAGPCGCSRDTERPAARVLVRPSDGVILARDLAAGRFMSPNPPGSRITEPNPPPDSTPGLEGRW